MHLKSCSKLVRSELRLDLGQQQGALLRRGQSNRLPLAALSTNTLRCGPQGGAVHGGAARAKGTENSGFTDDEASALDVWSVIRPGHVREKIALFAHDSDRTAKGSWDVTAKRRRRTSQIQPLQTPPPVVTVTLQTVARDPPSDPPLMALDSTEDDPKLSVVEMVAFLEQRVTCTPHAKLRSSASITLSRAPPLSSSPPAPNPVPAIPSDRPAAAEEPESLSVSDMVAKLESQCLRRRTPHERRVVGRVLLAEQHSTLLSVSGPQPISASETLKSPPPPSSETKKSLVGVRKSDMKIKPCVSTETRAQKTQATPTSPERSNAIGQGRTETLPPSQTKESKSEPVSFCKSEKTPQAETNAVPKCDSKATQKLPVNSAAILTLSVHSDMNAKTKTNPEVASATCAQVEKEVGGKCSAGDVPQLDKTLSPLSSIKSKKLLETSPLEEPLPGLLFLTPPSNTCLQSEHRTPVSPAPLSPNSGSDTVPLRRKTNRENSDSFVVLSLDLTVRSQTKTQRSALPSPATSSSLSQLEKSDLCSDKSERTCSSVTENLSQLEKRKSCPVTAAELAIQSEAWIELLPPESQSQRRRLNRIAQSEKRKSCPIPDSDWSVSQEDTRKSCPVPVSDSLERLSDSSSSQSETRRTFRPATGSDQSEARLSGGVLLRSSSDVGADRRRRRKAARAFSLCSVEGAGRYSEGVGRAASEDFLLMRRRVQSLLEPRTQESYLSLLPHHLLLQILLLLPTRALAALKCSCQYLRLIIDTYDPRPLDALWVCDPRYRDDPCKQCKRRHRRGDVSLCRWHHKPFCQAMPYGPGYWMCCHGDRRDAPGCNVGLHDNRWVPAFHSINAPLYRQRLRDEEEG